MLSRLKICVSIVSVLIIEDFRLKFAYLSGFHQVADIYIV